MALKKIELIGFKSFADRTVIEFKEGIIAVVGPNGCGKSNIADAFRWVLGETSAKSMRGAKMNDVIFAGTSKRKPLNFAEVAITFDNRDGLLPIEYEEVSVTRRLYRSGESEYLINRQQVRLKDIHSLLMGSGVGKNAFAIFEQGKIDQVIHLAPLDRRGIFDEAAGINRFLTQKRDALRKLQYTEQNIARVEDIYQEVEKQVKVLERQAEQARDYKEKKVEMEELEKGILVSRSNRYRAKIEKLDEKITAHQEGTDGVSLQYREWQNQRHEEQRELERLEEKQRQKREELFQMRSEKEVKSQEVENYKERQEEAVQREKKFEEECELLVGKRGELQKEEEKAAAEMLHFENDIKGRESEVQQQRSHTEKLEDDVGVIREKQNAIHQEKLKFLQEKSRSESILNQFSLEKEHHEKQVGKNEERKVGLEESIETETEACEKFRETWKDLTAVAEKQKEEVDQSEQALKGLSEEIQETMQSLQDVQREITESKARYQVLQRLRDEGEGFSQATKQLLEASQEAGSDLYGLVRPLYECVQIDDEHDPATVAIRAYAQTLVVDTIEKRNAVLKFARELDLGDFSLLCLEDIAEDPKTHFLKGLKVVETLDEALASVGGGEVWSREGIYVDTNRVVILPSFGESNVFMRQAELATLEETIEELQGKRESLENTIKDKQEKKKQWQQQQYERDNALRQLEMKKVEAHFALERAESDLQKSKTTLQQVISETVNLEKEIEQLDTEMANAKEKLSAFEKEWEGIQQRTSKMEAELQQNSDVLKQQQKHQRQLEIAFQQLLEQSQQAEYRHNIAAMQLKQNLEQEEKLKAEIIVCQQQKREMREKQESCLKALDELEKQLSALLEHCQLADSEVQDKKKVLHENEVKGEVLREEQQKSEQKLYQLEVEKIQQATHLETVETELLERHQLTIEEARALEITLPEELGSAEKKLRSLRRFIEAIGDVNMAAIDECQEYKQRHQFLTAQLEDLAKAKEELVKVIADLDEESRKKFQETFDAVRTNFQKNFSILFNGGEADLCLTDSLDILDAGIEITAKPPGKKMRSISLLSGGEKCLTAVALLFAIFEVKPAPFCVLDEIDAPLDDSNIARFVNVVKQFIDKCTFVIITHNKRTMSIADVIYGVSMQERGVTQLLSMEFSRDTVVQPVI